MGLRSNSLPCAGDHFSYMVQVIQSVVLSNKSIFDNFEDWKRVVGAWREFRIVNSVRHMDSETTWRGQVT